MVVEVAIFAVCGGVAMGNLQLGGLGIVEDQISFNRQESCCLSL